MSRQLQLVGLIVMTLGSSWVTAQTPPITPAAPIPPQISTARKIFISNAGMDIAARVAFRKEGQPEKAYNQFYAAIQKWGRYEIVASPADAELVFEVQFRAPMTFNGVVEGYEPQFILNIVDAKTHFVLWSVGEPVEGAMRKATWMRNFDRGLNALMDDIKKLSAPGSDQAKQEGGLHSNPRG